ncbi:hypothetical protein GJ744_009963 [Endocarpon pusillum]|uniref:ATP-dependent RNA helicase DHX8 n=1 Tax=Endocarpon pusillum TaxID=364733 RepID=A0A8H7AH04_9EURO|nr:hypothetical protein GJ744_009963 [Endocarpon pusillum]
MDSTKPPSNQESKSPTIVSISSLSSTLTPPETSIPYRQIRALYDDETITVYQAYSAAIATPAVNEQKLTASKDFKLDRMTWIKPSWCWMMYRAGYSYKDSRQTNILALKIKHENFRYILSCAAITSGHHGPLPASERKKPVRVQWDPERTASLGVLPYRSIQIGIGSNDNARTRHKAKRREIRAQATHENRQEWEADEGEEEEEEEEGNESKELKRKFVEEWIVEIQDVTNRARRLKEVVEARSKEGKSLKMEEAVSMGLCPRERVYAVSKELRAILQMDVPGNDDGKQDGVKREEGKKGGRGKLRLG